MIIAISIDEYIFETEGKFYGDNVGYDIVKRYADNFEHVRLITRVKHVTPDNLEMHNKLLPWENVEYCAVPFFNSIGGLVKKYGEIRKCVKETVKGCQVALVRSPSLVGFIALMSLDKNTPYGLEVVANPYEMYKGYKGLQKVQSIVMHYAQKHYCKKASALAFVTKYSQQRIYEVNKEKKFNAHYSSIELKKEFYNEFVSRNNFLDDKTVPVKIAHVSNIITGNIKGHQEVLDVASKLQQKGLRVEVTFAGDGPDVEKYKNIAAVNNIAVNFVGFIDKAQLRELLLNSDFFLFPSKSEGLPKVVIEAMAVSLPCIASNVGGIPELLPAESVFDSYDVDGMTNRILELASNKERYTENAHLMYNTALEYESSVLNERRRVFYKALKELV